MTRYRNARFLGYPKYTIGTDGSIWSKRSGKWRNLKPFDSNGHGHLAVVFHDNGRNRHDLVHRLVLLAFVGPCPEGMLCRHYPNQDPSDNRLENLSWATPLQNQHDRKENGTSIKMTCRRGERVPQSKMTD